MIMKYGECANNDFGIIDNDMSYGAELLEESRIDYEIWYDRNISNINNGIWIQKNGSKIKIQEMKNTHIQNCINMLKRRLEKDISNEFAELWIIRFEKELEFRQYIKNIMNGVLDHD